jgi:tetratricopeptide (TPR) repeat protein
MSDTEHSNFFNSIIQDKEVFFKMLSNIDIRKSESEYPTDRESIFKAIKENIPEGPSLLNGLVLKCLREWVITSFESRTRKFIIDSEYNKTVFSSSTASSSDCDDFKHVNTSKTPILFTEQSNLNDLFVLYVKNQPYSDFTINICNHLTALSTLYMQQGKFDIALDTINNVIEFRECHLGEEHLLTIEAIMDKATLYRKLIRYEEAKMLYIKCLNVRRQCLGSYHLDTAEALIGLGNAYANLNEHESALDVELQCLNIQNRNLGEQHYKTLYTMHGLGFTYRQLNQLDKSAEMYSNALKHRKAILGEYHPDTLITMLGLSITWSAQEKNAEAEEMLQLCYLRTTEQSGVNHPHSTATAYQLALLHKKLDNVDLALHYFDKCNAGRNIELGENHAKTV